MIKAICADCKHIFDAPFILGEVLTCPKCGSDKIHAAVKK
jgi:DNA-directed RNA polymerase subunit RPC12/RpoP